MMVLRILIAMLILSYGNVEAQTLRAGEAIEKIQHRYAASPPPNTVDMMKEGEANTTVRGIGAGCVDTMDVLRESVGRGDNLIITHEPTFYNHLDDRRLFLDDPVYKEKLAYIEQHHLVVFRLHDEI